MNKSVQGKSDSDCFDLFVDSPKNVSTEILKGAHKFVAKAIKDGSSGPTCQTLIKIFTAFTQQKIKDYVFTRMKKPILLELALCIIQDIVLNGAGRAKTLQLEVVKSKAGGKTVKIVDQFAAPSSKPDDTGFLDKIDEAFFKLRDSEGNSPDVHIASGQGHKAPYTPFGKDGGLIRPKPSVVRNLNSSIEVSSDSLKRTLPTIFPAPRRHLRMLAMLILLVQTSLPNLSRLEEPREKMSKNIYSYIET